MTPLEKEKFLRMIKSLFIAQLSEHVQRVGSNHSSYNEGCETCRRLKEVKELHDELWREL